MAHIPEAPPPVLVVREKNENVLAVTRYRDTELLNWSE